MDEYMFEDWWASIGAERLGNTYKTIVKAGWNHGYNEGYNDGHEDGEQKGFDEGYSSAENNG